MVQVSATNLLMNEGDTATVVFDAGDDVFPSPTTVTLSFSGPVTVNPDTVILSQDQSSMQVVVSAPFDFKEGGGIQATTIRIRIENPEMISLSSSLIRVIVTDQGSYRFGFHQARFEIQEGESSSATISIFPPPLPNNPVTLEVVSDKKQLIIMPSTVTFTDKITKKEVNIKVRDNRVTEGRAEYGICLLYTSPSPRDRQKSRMPSSA